MKRSIAETVLGALIILIAGLFLTYSYKAADMSSGQGYIITADFSSVGGLKTGDNIQVSGVKVGSVGGVQLMPETFLARVYLNIRDGFSFPSDTAAKISSESLLGGLYLELDPGADDTMIAPGGKIQYTQAPQNLEQLLGQFIFSMSNEKDSAEKKNEAE